MCVGVGNACKECGNDGRGQKTQIPSPTSAGVINPDVGAGPLEEQWVPLALTPAFWPSASVLSTRWKL